jgi:Flp pilus assembly protein TadG
MPAANIETLYQFENALEAAAKSILTTSASLTAYRQRDTDTVATPWAAVQLSGVRADGNFHMIGDVGWPSSFDGQLRVVVVTNRGQNAASHITYVGKVRRNLYDLTLWTSVLLPNHKVWSVMETGTSPQISGDENQDATEITFALKWLIIESEWP